MGLTTFGMNALGPLVLATSTGIVGWLESINGTLKSIGTTLGTTGNIIMSIAAIAFIVWHVIQGYRAAKDDKFTDLIKHALLAVLGVILAVVGVSGFLSAAQSVTNGATGSAGNDTVGDILSGKVIPIKPYIWYVKYLIG